MRELFPGARRPWVIAHRGDSHACPENTLPAFAAALSAPIDGIELDVQLSRDGVPVVFHDRTLKKAGGGGRRVGSLDLAGLRALDFGAWFGAGFSGERIPTLDEVLERCGRGTRLLLEIKAHERGARNAPHRDLVERTVAAVRRAALTGHVVVLSFEPSILDTARRIEPRLPVALNLRELPRLTASARARIEALAAVSVDVRAVTPRFVQQMHAAGKPVLTYTCNSPRTCARALRAGVDGIMSDRPGWLRDVLDGRCRAPGTA